MYLHKTYDKDPHLENFISGNLFVAWFATSWMLYPERWWLWCILLFSGIAALLLALQKFQQAHKESCRRRLFCIAGRLFLPLLPFWMVWQTWEDVVFIIVFVAYILAILAIWQSGSVDVGNRKVDERSLAWNWLYSYIGVFCAIAGFFWFYIAPDQVQKSQWLILGGSAVFYQSWHDRAKARQGGTGFLWADLLIGMFEISILVLGWNNPMLSPLLLGGLFFKGRFNLQKFALEFKKAGNSSPFILFIGILIFSAGVWMGRTQAGAYIWQLILEIEGMGLFVRGIFRNTWNDWLIDHPWSAVMCFLGSIIGLSISAPYLVKAFLVQQTLVYDVLWGMVASSLALYLSIYLWNITPRNAQLILEEVLLNKNTQEEFKYYFTRWRVRPTKSMITFWRNQPVTKRAALCRNRNQRLIGYDFRNHGVIGPGSRFAKRNQPGRPAWFSPGLEWKFHQPFLPKKEKNHDRQFDSIPFSGVVPPVWARFSQGGKPPFRPAHRLAAPGAAPKGWV